MGLILRSALALVFQSGHVLMEGAPADLDLEALRASLAGEVAGVQNVHHVHAWSLKPGQPLLTMHLEIDETADHDAVLHRAQAHLLARYRIDHATIQIERGPCTAPATPSRHP
jgi:cobalt-zinc-cadmium efflux system protein